MVVKDNTVGMVLHVINTVSFIYWLSWVGVTPFVDASHFTQKLFPLPREYGIAVPVAIVLLIVLIGMTTASLHIIRETGLSAAVKRARLSKARDSVSLSQPPPADVRASASSIRSGGSRTSSQESAFS